MSTTEFFEGDIVRIEQGDEAQEGRVQVNGYNEPYLSGTLGARAFKDLLDGGWTIKLLKRALPTEPGFYLDKEGDAWLLDTRCKWAALTSGQGNRGNLSTTLHPADFFPFKKLVVES